MFRFKTRPCLLIVQEFDQAWDVKGIEVRELVLTGDSHVVDVETWANNFIRDTTHKYHRESPIKEFRGCVERVSHVVQILAKKQNKS